MALWIGMVATSLALVGISARPAAADGTGFQKVGSIDLKHMGAHIVAVDTSARVVDVVCLGGCPGGTDAPSDAYYARAYNADTMAEVANLPASETRAAPLNSLNVTGWYLDQSEHRLYFVDANGHFVVLDSRTLVVVSTFTRDVGDAQVDGHVGTRSGLFYSPATKLLYMVMKGTNTDETVTAIDPHSTPAAGQVMWTTHLNQCGKESIIPDANQPILTGVTKDGKFLYSVCGPTQGVASGSNVSYDIVRLTLPDASTAPPPPPPGGLVAPYYNGAVDLYPGLVTGGGGYAFDATWVPGLDRIVAFIPGGNNVSHAMAVFDTATNMFISAPTLFSNGGNATTNFGPLSYAVDPVTGRLVVQTYAFTPSPTCQKIIAGSNAFAVSETALLSNHLAVEQTGDDSLNPADGSLIIQMGYDSATHNVWIPSWPINTSKCQNTAGSTGAPILTVYHDGLPAAHATVNNPDANTQNIAESDQTGTNANAQASAFGARYQVAPSGVEGSLTHVYVSPATLTCDVSSFYYLQTFVSPHLPTQQPPALPPQYNSFCTPASRTLTFAHVSDLSLDASEVRSEAIAADTNRDSARDLENGTDISHPGPWIDKSLGYAGGPNACQTPDASTGGTSDRCVLPSPYSGYTTGQQAPYAPAACSDTGGNAQTATPQYTPAQIEKLPSSMPVGPVSVGAGASMPGYAAAGCDFGNLTGSAAASNSDSSFVMPIFANSSNSSATVSRSADVGTSAVATASAEGITLGGVLHIGRIDVKATVQAHGRPKTSQTNYTCTVTGFELDLPNQNPVTLPPVGCNDSRLLNAAAQFNHAFTGILHIDFPVAYAAGDPAAPLGDAGVVLDATPGGYEARVQASELNRDQNQILLNDSSLEHPALVATLIDDTSQRHNRYVATFAAVAASATYGIFGLPADLGGGDGSFSNGSGPDTGVVGQTGDSGSAGSVSVPTPAPTAARNNTGGGGPIAALQRLGQAIVDGVNVLLQHPGLIPPLIAVWALLGSPAYLLSRRRSLVAATRGTL